jgi:hypothetical protein
MYRAKTKKYLQCYNVRKPITIQYIILLLTIRTTFQRQEVVFISLIISPGYIPVKQCLFRITQAGIDISE